MEPRRRSSGLSSVRATKQSLRQLARITGAREAPFPNFIEPAHPTQHERPPIGEKWVHEIKVDGYRAQIHIKNGEARVYSRRGNDWTDRFMSIAHAAKQLPIKEAVIDGEVIVATPEGLSDFSALQSEIAAECSDRFTFYAFDLLYADGLDLRPAPLVERKAALARLLLKDRRRRFLFADHLEIEGATVFGRACAMGIEGVVSKLRDSPYQSGRIDTWRKALCRKRDTFPVIGFIAEQPRSIAALYLGRREGEELLYAGKAGTGFTFGTARALRERLQPLVVRKSSLTTPVRKPKATWVRPELLVDIQYRSITPDGRLRHASFKGVRDDLR
jgi:bifunctional non-homologous end joining protein LigD